ncbi:glutathione S-transferase family protein [Bdellovibrio sp. HCB185ZH]|uniref:glutathione S-transferase family protein n=1 Tax=Bdellovibrio sp. HCB185ZH TaxID=3394235 RepID=UPI0039A6511D
MIDFYTAHTPNGRKVWIMLEELGIPYKVHEIDLKKGEQKTPEFLAMNPNGRIPVIVDNSAIDSVTVFESAAILYYLASKYEGRFFGYGLDERTYVMEWMMFQMSAVGPNFGNLHYGQNSMDPKVPAFIERFEKESKRIVGVLEIQLGKNEYLAGGNYTIADMCTYTWVAAMLEKQPQIFTDAPKVKQWAQKISERPAVQKAMALSL